MIPSPYWDLRKAWKEWQNLPASKRAPSAFQVEERGVIDLTKTLPKPPPGGLILKLYYRSLARGTGGNLRYVQIKDFVHNHSMAKNPKNIHEIAYIDLAIGNKAFHEANPDFLWLTEKEWKSLLPADPKKGDRMRVSPAVTERLFRFHLVPTMAFGEAIGWAKEEIRAGQLALVVEDVAANKVRLRLEGFAMLGPDFETADNAVKKKQRSWGFEPRLLGYLEYHPAKKIISRFDIVALGDTYGMLQEGLRFFYRPGRHPLGVAFELVSAEAPANCVPGRAVMGEQREQQYFATGR